MTEDVDGLTALETARELLRRKLAKGPQGGCTSYIQRQMQCSYALAASLVEKLAKEKFITDADHTGKRGLVNA